MDRDTVLKLARKACITFIPGVVNDDDLENFAALVAAHEREACARVCDERAAMYMPVNRDVIGRTSQTEARLCADAIRARGTHGGGNG